MSAWFETVFRRVIGHEGGFQAHPGDRANWTTGVIGKGKNKGTKFGVSAMTYPHLDIKNLTLEQAKEIYFRDWWEKMQMRHWPEAASYQMFDAAINHSMVRANEMLQRAVGVKDDGIIGPITMKAVHETPLDDLCFLFLAERLEFFTQIGTFGVYGKGWCRRIAQNLRYAAKDTPYEPITDKPDSPAPEQELGFDLSRPSEKAGGPDSPGRTRAKWGTQGAGSEHGGYSGRGAKPRSVD